MTHRMTRPVTLLGLSLALAAPAAVAGRPHQHGVAELALVIEGSLVSAQLDTPLDSLVGFERAPRTPAERDRAQAALARLSAPDGLLPMPASAGCAAPSAKVHAPVLQGEAAADGHADAQVTWTWRCARTDGLRSLTHGLFEAFAPLQRVQVTVVTATGQHRVTLRRPQRELRWGR